MNNNPQGLFEGLPQHVPPLYETDEVSAPVQIASSEDIRLKTPKGTAVGRADVYLRWRTTRPGIVIEAEVIRAEEPGASVSLILDTLFDAGADLQLASPGRERREETFEMAVYCTSSKTGGGDFAQLRLVPEGGGALSTKANQLTSVTFSLCNFWNYVGRPITFPSKDTPNAHKGRLLLQSERWRVVLDAHPETKRLCEELKREGGYALTHTGRIERTDSESFSAEEAEELLTALAHFFSFARGLSVAPLLAVGFDRKELRAWEDWSVRTIAPWAGGGSSNWFDPVKCPGDLEKLFPKFIRKWHEPLWKEALRSALYWYERANRGASAAGTDGSIILAHSALDLLAWTLLVRDQEVMSRSKYKGRRYATDNLRDLLRALGIPLALPRHLETLTALSEEEGWSDGPRVLSEVRNGVVHPDRGFSASSNTYIEAWVLGLYYVELSILSLLGYEGRFSNRTRLQRRQGEVEDVPWA